MFGIMSTDDEVVLIEYCPVSPRSVKDGCLSDENENDDRNVTCAKPSPSPTSTTEITSRYIAKRALQKIQRRRSYPSIHDTTNGSTEARHPIQHPLTSISSLETRNLQPQRISTVEEAPSRKSQSPGTKWVRFHLDPTHIPTDVVLEDQDMKNMWWTNEERRRCRVQNQEYAIRFWNGRPDYRHAIEDLLYTASCQVHDDYPGDSLAPVTENVDADDPHGQNCSHHHHRNQLLIDTVTDSDMRGLEKTVMTRIHSASMISFQHLYQTVISDVLQQQVVLKHLSLDPHQRATCLAKLVSQYSVRSEQFARFLAEGDARVAKRYHEQQAHCHREE
jgi:hypothetical protein